MTSEDILQILARGGFIRYIDSDDGSPAHFAHLFDHDNRELCGTGKKMVLVTPEQLTELQSRGVKLAAEFDLERRHGLSRPHWRIFKLE